MADYIDVAAYGRNSDDKQTTSQAIQDDIFQHFASSNDGFKALFGKKANIVENYKDHGKSASKKKSKRTDFTRMLNDVASGKVKIVLILNTSRFSRLHPVDTLMFLATFRDNNAMLVSIQDRKIIEIDELGDLITNIVKFNSDHEYARTLAANVLRGHLFSVKTKGKAHVSHIPYGMSKLVITDTGERIIYKRNQYIKVPKEWNAYLIPGNETEQEVVRWIFRTYLDEDISLCEIARRLNNHDNPQVRAGVSGKGWDESAIRRLLRNRHYRAQEFWGFEPTGEHYRTCDGQAVATKQAMEAKPLVVETPVEPLIAPDIFESAQKKLNRQKGKKTRSLNTEGACLTGCLVCGHCGHPLFLASNGRKYVCKSRRGGKTQCRVWGVCEQEVFPWLISRIDKELLRRIEEHPTVETIDAPKVKEQIATIDAKISTIQQQLGEPTTTVETCKNLASVMKSLGEEKECLQAKLRGDDYRELLELAFDRWEAIIKPQLVGIKTGNVGEGNEAVETLGIGEEVDRLFNYSYFKPSKVRELFHSLETQVVCFFKQLPPPKRPRSTGKYGRYAVDHGRVTISLNGVITGCQKVAIRSWID